MLYWRVFAAAFVVGLVAGWLHGPAQRIVLVHPTPETAPSHLYRDKSGTCFAPTPMQVECGPDATDYPVQAKLSP